MPDSLPPKVGYLYNEIEITVTILDKDHKGYMRSTLTIFDWTNEKLNELKSTMDGMFTKALTNPSYNQDNCVSFMIL